MRTLPKNWFSLRPLAVVDAVAAVVGETAADVGTAAAVDVSAAAAGGAAAGAADVGAGVAAADVGAGAAAADVGATAAEGVTGAAADTGAAVGAGEAGAAVAPEAAATDVGAAAAGAAAGEAGTVSPAATAALAAPDVAAPAAAAPAVVAPSAPLPVAAGGAAGAGGVVSPTDALALANQDAGLIAGGGDASADVSQTALGTLASPPTDEAQAELTQAGVNATGSNAAQAASVQDALATPGAVTAADKAQSFLTGRDLLTLGLAGSPLAMALVRGQPAQPSAAKPLAPGGDVTGPLVQTEKQNLDAANSGTITAPQQAQIDQFVQNSQNQLYQQLANEGVADPTKDSRYIQGVEDIRQRAMALTQKYLDDDRQAGLAAAGAASGALNTATQAQLATDQDFQAALSSATESFGLIAGLSAAQRAAA